MKGKIVLAVFIRGKEAAFFRRIGGIKPKILELGTALLGGEIAQIMIYLSVGVAIHDNSI